MKKTLTTLAAAAMAAGLAFAQAPAAAPTPTAPAHKRPLRAMARHRAIQALNLTDAQKQQAKTIFQQSRATTQPIREQLKQNREALASAVKANDTNQIQQLAQAQGTLMGQVAAARARARAQFYQILTPDQRAKADESRGRRTNTGARG